MILISCKRWPVLGGGVGGRVELELGVHQLDLWIAMPNQALRGNDYNIWDEVLYCPVLV